MGLFAFAFGASAWVALDLWRNKPWAFRWAQVLLIAQMPAFSFPGLAYHFYTGLTLGVTVSPSGLSFEFEVGSGMLLRFSSEIEGFAFGINVIAAFALFLLGKARGESRQPNMGSHPSQNGRFRMKTMILCRCKPLYLQGKSLIP